MIEFAASGFSEMLRDVTMSRERLTQYGKELGATTELEQKDRNMFRKDLLKRVQIECSKIGLDAAANHAERIARKLKEGVRYTYELLEREMEGIRVDIERDLAKIRCAYIPAEVAKYFEQEKLFGDCVYKAFPSTRGEIKDAGNCLAAGLHTGCVFHLMRVAEIGLRILARDRRVKLKKARLDYAEWQTIISGIEKSIEVLALKRRGPKRAAALDFYRGSLGELYAFKDAWRNHVMHSRTRYDAHQAQSIVQHVSEFMVRLSARLSESKVRPVAWKL